MEGEVRRFASGVAQEFCVDCREGDHARCEYVVEMHEMNTGAVFADDFIVTRPRCWCYRSNEERHWKEFEESKWSLQIP